jgi:predicted enzyme related to lactoylglutathione lyase
MSSKPCPFVWYELMTTDPKAAEGFYRSVVGWTMADAGMPGRSYTLLSAGPTMIGGLMAIPDDARRMGAPPAWIGYIGVDDVDGCAGKLRAAGGAIHRPPDDIPGVGRFAVAADPHGAAFVLFKGASDQMPAPVAPGTPGHVGWHELHAGDGAAAFDFYAGQFGWTLDREMDMGPMGKYLIFASGAEAVGGIMTRMPEMPVPAWVYYFNVDAIDAAAQRVAAGGGKVINGPMEVPGGQWILQGLDPQGALFALVAPGR